MSRVAAFLVGLIVASVLVFVMNREREKALPSPDLGEARATFAEGEYDLCKALAVRVARVQPAPVAWLLEGVEHENPHVRHWSVYALGDAYALGTAAPPDERVVETLMRAFDDEDDWVRAYAARALGNIGPPAKAALPMLRKAAGDVREEIVHARAEKAVLQILGEPYDEGE